VKIAYPHRMSQAILLHEDDLPISALEEGISVAIDTETTGLNLFSDRLCLIQFCFGTSKCHLVRINKGRDYPNVCTLLANNNIKKIFHYARFDIAMLYMRFKVLAQNVYCTKIASKFARSYTERHGLANICRELLGIEISKEQQSSDWGGVILSEAQKTYAASDVLYLHQIYEILNERLIREDRFHLASECFKFLPTRALLDCFGMSNDVFDWSGKLAGSH